MADETPVIYLNGIARRYKQAGSFPTKYWTPEVQKAAFALPPHLSSPQGGEEHES